MAQSISESELACLKRDARQGYPAKPSTETIHLLGRHLVTELINQKLLAENYSEKDLERWILLAFQIAHKFSQFPFTSQKEILNDLNLDLTQLKKLNTALRFSSIIQSFICDFGAAWKYWHNTIIPTVSSDGFSAVINRRHKYPFRVGLFPGVSCMFQCSFCGRNYGARYDNKARFSGNDVFRAMMASAPNNDPNRFYFSGGLEPLTNTEIGSLISYSKEIGLKTSMYTNGYMLTPKLLNKNPGILELEMLRLSLYGLDESSAVSVTGKKGSYDRVIQNVSDYIQLKSEIRSGTKFGINFVLLPQNIDSLIELAKLVRQFNEIDPIKGVSFITLREDFSALPKDGIPLEDRNRMVSIFEEFEDLLNSHTGSDVNIDYGYALQSIRDGFNANPLEMVSDRELRGDGYPQISVVVDLLGDVYIYREAGFLDRPGADRYIIGRVTPDTDLDAVIKNFIDSGDSIKTEPGDWRYLDAFDHVMVKLLNQAEDDEKIGIPFNLGPVYARTIIDEGVHNEKYPILAHPTLSRD